MSGRSGRKARSRKLKPAAARPGGTQRGAAQSGDGERPQRKKQASGKQALARLRRAQRRRFLFHAVIAAVVAGVLGWSGYAIISDQLAERIPGLETNSGLSRQHVTGEVSYSRNPPMGGAHSGQPLACGIYDEPVPAEQAVHSMEHGAVWIAYQPDLAEDKVAALEKLVRAAGDKMILSPHQGLDSPVVITAWGKQLKVNSVTDERLARFIHVHKGGGPEPDADC